MAPCIKAAKDIGYKKLMLDTLFPSAKIVILWPLAARERRKVKIGSRKGHDLVATGSQDLKATISHCRCFRKLWIATWVPEYSSETPLILLHIN